MCILFTYCGDKDVDSDYRLIVVENRDEYYDRPASNLAEWEDSPIVAGVVTSTSSFVCSYGEYECRKCRDLGACDGDGTWFAVSPERRKLGVLLNLPGNHKPDAKSRGRIVTDYLQCNSSTEEYVNMKHSFFKEVNEFVLVTVDFGEVEEALASGFSRKETNVQTYSNVSDNILNWEDSCQGFSNSQPENPLMKAVAGRELLRDICTRLNKVPDKEMLIEQLIKLLKSNEQHLPDQQLEKRNQSLYQHFSSIFVSIPEGRYGTRTHTIVLLSKTGHLDVIEISLQGPVDLQNPNWKRTEYQANI